MSSQNYPHNITYLSKNCRSCLLIASDGYTSPHVNPETIAFLSTIIISQFNRSHFTHMPLLNKGLILALTQFLSDMYFDYLSEIDIVYECCWVLCEHCISDGKWKTSQTIWLYNLIWLLFLLFLSRRLSVHLNTHIRALEQKR